MNKNNIKNIYLFIIISALWLSACDPSATNQQQQLHQQELTAKDLIILAGRNDISNEELLRHLSKYLASKGADHSIIDADVNGAKFLHNVAKRRPLDFYVYKILDKVLNTLRLSSAQLNATVIDKGQNYTVLKYLLSGSGDFLDNSIAIVFAHGAKEISPAATEEELKNLLDAFRPGFGISADNLLASDINLGQGPNNLPLAFLNAFQPALDLKSNTVGNFNKRLRFKDLIDNLKSFLEPARTSEWRPYASQLLTELASKADGLADAYGLLKIEPDREELKTMLVDLDNDQQRQEETEKLLTVFLDDARQEDKDYLLNADLGQGQKVIYKVASLFTTNRTEKMLKRLLEEGASLADLGNDPSDFIRHQVALNASIKHGFDGRALKRAFDTIDNALGTKLTKWACHHRDKQKVRQVWGEWYIARPDEPAKMAARSDLLGAFYDYPSHQQAFIDFFEDEWGLIAGLRHDQADLYELAKNPGPGMLRGQLMQVIAARVAQDEAAGTGAMQKMVKVANKIRELFIIAGNEAANTPKWDLLMSDNNFGITNNLGNVSVKDLVTQIPVIFQANREARAKSLLLCSATVDDINNEAYYLASSDPLGDTKYLELLFKNFDRSNGNMDDLANNAVNGFSFLENLVRLKVTHRSFEMMDIYLDKLSDDLIMQRVVRGLNPPASPLSILANHNRSMGDILSARRFMLVDLIHYGMDDELSLISDPLDLQLIFNAYTYRNEDDLIKVFKAVVSPLLIPIVAKWVISTNSNLSAAFNKAYLSSTPEKQKIMRNSLISEAYDPVVGPQMVIQIIEDGYLPEEALKLSDYDPYGFGEERLIYNVIKKIENDGVLLEQAMIQSYARALKAKFSGPNAEADWNNYLTAPGSNPDNQSIVDLVLRVAGIDADTAKDWLIY